MNTGRVTQAQKGRFLQYIPKGTPSWEFVAPYLLSEDALEQALTMAAENLELFPNGEAETTPVSLPVLRRGKIGADVRYLQRLLNAWIARFRLPVVLLKEDGIFGPLTVRRVQSLQQATPLASDGIVGPQTWGRLLSAVAVPVTLGLRPAGPTSAVILPECATIGQPCEVLEGFAHDRADVPPVHERRIGSIADCVVATQRTQQPIGSMLVVGHASSEGSDEYNFQLGLQRAETLIEKLKEAIRTRTQSTPFAGLEGRILFFKDSGGEKEPIADNATEAGRSRNRRVAICLPPLPIVRPPGPSVQPPDAKCKPPLPTPPVPADMDKLIRLVRRILSGLPTRGLGAIGVVLPSVARFLDAEEQREAMSVYGGSLDFTKILITDGLGFRGAAFTAAVPLSAGFHVAMNLGDLCSWASKPRSHKLIHELAHAWQSQHHGSSPVAFMDNSVKCQALALADLPVAKGVAGVKATKSAIASGIINPRDLARIFATAAAAEDVSAYAYFPERRFGEYAAEQIAQQVEDSYRRLGTATPGVLSIISSVSANVRSLDNEKSLTVTIPDGFHRKSEPPRKIAGIARLVRLVFR
jgi:hypothetical protein